MELRGEVIFCDEGPFLNVLRQDLPGLSGKGLPDGRSVSAFSAEELPVSRFSVRSAFLIAEAELNLPFGASALSW